MAERCKATNASGQLCQLKAGVSGYCHIHDPQKIEERKSQNLERQRFAQEQWAKGYKLRDVIDVVETVAKTRGWRSETVHIDRENWKFASISVNRWDGSSLSKDFVTLCINVIESGVQISCDKTNLYARQVKEIISAITSEASNLPWVLKQEKNAENPSSSNTHASLQQLKGLLERFPIVARQLEHRHANRAALSIQDEYDVQDLLHALLKIIFDDVRPEEHTPSYAGRSSRIDFLLKDDAIAVEVKMAAPRLRDREIGEQLIIDIHRYQSHPNCKTLICFVYDPAYCLQNPSGIEKDLSHKVNGLNVQVIIVPQ